MKITHILLVILLCFGCGGDSGGESSSNTEMMPDAAVVDMDIIVDAEVLTPTLASAPSTLFVPSGEAGQSVQLRFELVAGAAPADITNVALELTGARTRLLYKRTFQTGIDGDGMDRFSYPLVVDPSASLPMMLEVTPNGAEPLSGQLTITGNFEGGELIIPIEQGSAGAQLQLSTQTVAFGRVAEKNTKTETVTMTNVGGTVLNIQNILMRSFGIDFSAQLNGEDAIENDAAYLDPDGDGMPGLAPGGSADLEVTYAPMSEGSDDAAITIRTDAIMNAEQVIELSANDTYSCLDVTPETMRCEGVLEQLTVCDTQIVVSNCHESEPLIIDEITMNASTDAFFIDEDSLPTMPHSLPIGESVIVEIRYFPGVARSNHRGNLLIHANDLDSPSRNIQLTGFTPCENTMECPMEYECINNECIFNMMPEGEGDMPQ